MKHYIEPWIFAALYYPAWWLAPYVCILLLGGFSYSYLEGRRLVQSTLQRSHLHALIFTAALTYDDIAASRVAFRAGVRHKLPRWIATREYLVDLAVPPLKYLILKCF